MNQNDTGKLIALIRKNKGLTQQELGDLIGVSSKTVSKWECGIGLPDISSLKIIGEVLGITVDELLDGKLQDNGNNEKKNYKIKLINFIPLIIILMLIISMYIYKLLDDSDSNNNDLINCTVIRTYDIDSIGKSNDENYLYITVHEYQVEGTFTLKLPIIISENLEVGKSYEFTFKTTREFINTTTDLLFNNSNIINVEYSGKIGMDRKSISYCEGDDFDE